MGLYATVQDMRDEGVTVASASDARLLELLEEASIDIDRYCGWWFDPRDRTLRLDGRGTQTLELPVHPIEITSLVADEDDLSIEPEDLRVVGAPVEPGLEPFVPYIQLTSVSFRGDRVRRGGDAPLFPVGRGLIYVTGTFGYTEDDGTAQGRVPLAIKRACKLMVIRNLAELANADPLTSQAWRVQSIKTFDQSVTFGTSGASGALGDDGAAYTGDPTIDEILSRFAKPHGVGATLGVVGRSVRGFTL